MTDTNPKEHEPPEQPEVVTPDLGTVHIRPEQRQQLPAHLAVRREMSTAMIRKEKKWSVYICPRWPDWDSRKAVLARILESYAKRRSLLDEDRRQREELRGRSRTSDYYLAMWEMADDYFLSSLRMVLDVIDPRFAALGDGVKDKEGHG